MKQHFVIFALVMSLALAISFISCEDNGEEGNFFGSSSSFSFGLPDPVGTNELVGKKIVTDYYYVSSPSATSTSGSSYSSEHRWVFSNDMTATCSDVKIETKTTDGETSTQETVLSTYNYKYSYDSTKKLVYLLDADYETKLETYRKKLEAEYGKGTDYYTLQYAMEERMFKIPYACLYSTSESNYSELDFKRAWSGDIRTTNTYLGSSKEPNITFSGAYICLNGLLYKGIPEFDSNNKTFTATMYRVASDAVAKVGTLKAEYTLPTTPRPYYVEGIIKFTELPSEIINSTNVLLETSYTIYTF